jgi:ATP-binding cassette subfamily F protein 3
VIDFKDICKSYGEQTVLDNATFRINRGERVGIVGPNGAGKSTIFGIITGDIYPDKGAINYPKDMRIGYLRQHLTELKSETALLDFTKDAVADLNDIEEKIHQIEKNLPDEKDENERKRLLEHLGKLQHDFEHLGGYRLKSEAEAALTGLGFHPEELDRPLSSFSGGWQMRAGLAKALIADTDILLLDEPSNYLDIPAIEWLYRFLNGFKGTLLLISHDRYLLKTLTNITLEVNGGNATRYSGDYDFYIRERENRLLSLEAAKKNQDKKREQLERSIERFRSKNTKASQVQSWIKTLDKMDDINLPEQLHYSGGIIIPPAPHSGAEIARLEKAALSYDHEKWILKDIDLQINRGEKIAFVGYNGTGKTTLLKILAGVMPPTEGKKVLGHKAVVGYQAQEFGEILPDESSVYDTVKSAAPPETQSKSVRSILGAFGFSGEQADKRCKVLSGGEKIRLCFARIFVNPPNFLILDEPTTHLDIAAREALQDAIKNYDGTVCLVSHDIEFVRKAAETIIAMEPPSIRKYFGNYDYYCAKSAELNKVSNTVADNSTEEEKNSQKNRRKERAARRNELLPLKREAERKVSKLEKEIEKLEEEKQELLDKLMENAPNTDFASINKRIKDIDYSLAEKTIQWEEAALKLESIISDSLAD